MANHRKSSNQLALLGAYEDKYSECLKLLLQDCEEEMLHLFNVECGDCLLAKKCVKDWIHYVCNHRTEIKPEQFVEIVRRFLVTKQEAREQFRYRRTICLRLTTSS